MKVIFILFGISLIFVLGTESATKQVNSKCNQKTIQKIDKQMSFVPLLSGAKLPETEKQLVKMCGSVSQSVDMTSAYLKTCGGTFGPFISKTMTTISKKEMNSVCKLRNQKWVDLLLSAGKCGNSVSNKITKCLNDMLDTISAFQAVPIDDMINSGCCHAYRIVSCIQKSVVRSKKCDKEMIENIERVAFEEFGYLCGQYFSDNQKCNKLVSKTPKLNSTYVRPKSVFPPLMALMDTFRNMKCTAQTDNKIDSVVQELLTIGVTAKIPENSEQMGQWCSTTKQHLPYFYGYIESCLSDFGKWLIKIMVGMVATNFEPFCSRKGVQSLDNPSPQMQMYKSAAKCGNKAEDKLKVCFDNFNEKILGIVEAPEMSRIKMACCNAYNFRTCIFNATSSTKGCSSRTIEWAERQVMGNVERPITMVCNDLWGNAKKCDKLMADIPKMDPKTYVKPKSPFFPMIKMLDSFPDVDIEKK